LKPVRSRRGLVLLRMKCVPPAERCMRHPAKAAEFYQVEPGSGHSIAKALDFRFYFA